MWDSQNDIYNYNFRPCPCTASRFDSQFELSRGKWSHFPLSKIRVQPARMILIIILIFAYYIIFQWKNVKNITFKQESNYEKFYENSWNQVIKFYPEFNLDINENGQRGNKWYCIINRLDCSTQRTVLDTFTCENASVPKMLRNVAVLLVSPETDDIKISISSTSQEIQLIQVCTSKACQYENAYFNMT